MSAVHLRSGMSLALLLWTATSCGRNPAPPLPAAAQLFGDRVGDVSRADQWAIMTLLEFELSPDSVLVDSACRQPVHVDHVDVRDLDGDGTVEVVFLGGNACVSGGAGQSLVLLARDETGSYRTRLAFPAASYELIPRSVGLPDVRIASVRPCAGVWRWAGSGYEHLRNEPLEPGGCDP